MTLFLPPTSPPTPASRMSGRNANASFTPHHHQAAGNLLQTSVSSEPSGVVAIDRVMSLRTEHHGVAGSVITHMPGASISDNGDHWLFDVQNAVREAIEENGIDLRSSQRPIIQVVLKPQVLQLNQYNSGEVHQVTNNNVRVHGENNTVYTAGKISLPRESALEAAAREEQRKINDFHRTWEDIGQSYGIAIYIVLLNLIQFYVHAIPDPTQRKPTDPEFLTYDHIAFHQAWLAWDTAMKIKKQNRSTKMGKSKKRTRGPPQQRQAQGQIQQQPYVDLSNARMRMGNIAMSIETLIEVWKNDPSKSDQRRKYILAFFKEGYGWKASIEHWPASIRDYALSVEGGQEIKKCGMGGGYFQQLQNKLHQHRKSLNPLAGTSASNTNAGAVVTAGPSASAATTSAIAPVPTKYFDPKLVLDPTTASTVIQNYPVKVKTTISVQEAVDCLKNIGKTHPDIKKERNKVAHELTAHLMKKIFELCDHLRSIRDQSVGATLRRDFKIWDIARDNFRYLFAGGNASLDDGNPLLLIYKLHNPIFEPAEDYHSSTSLDGQPADFEEDRQDLRHVAAFLSQEEVEELKSSQSSTSSAPPPTGDC